MDFFLLLSAASNSLMVEGVLVILTTGLIASLLCRQFSMPPLMGYIATGIAIGPSALGLIRVGIGDIEHVAEIGVFLLLFSIGLELTMEQISRSAKFLLVGGPLQMALVAVPTALLLLWLGWPGSKAWLVGAAFSFSSTVLVFKSLGEFGGTSTRTGQATIAILLFQDAALIPLLLCLPLLMPNSESSGSSWVAALQWVSTGLVTIGFIAGTLLCRVFMTHIAIPRIMKHRSPEVVVLLAIVVLGTVTLIASRIGLPAAIGAFAAGVILGETRWAEQIDTLILPFREVFSAIFFVSLGLLIEPIAIFERPLLIAGLILGLVFLKTFASMLAFKAIGLSLKNSIGPALGLAHVGEFAFVLIMLASTAGVVNESERQVVFAVAGGTLLAAPLLIRWGFKHVGEESSTDEKRAIDSVHQLDSELPHAVVIGMGPIGRATASQLNTIGYELSCVDLNPLNLQLFSQQGIARVVAGDAQSADCLNAAGIGHANLVIICIPQDEISVRVTELCRSLNQTAVIIVRCRYVHTMNQLRQIGATHVISEEAYAAEELVKLISK